MPTNYLHEFTPEMLQSVDALINRNFKDATPVEIELYAQWKTLQALQTDEINSMRETRDAMIQAQIERDEAQAKSAIDALEALADLARAKLKAVENGQA